MGIRSTNAVMDHLRAIERKGYIRRDAVKSRGIVLAGASNVTGTSLESRLRIALAKYTIIATEGDRLVKDLATELAAALAG